MPPLDAGWAAILGAVVGGILTVIGNVIMHWLKSYRTNKLNDARRKTLKRLLSHKKYKWRELDTLMASIGADKETTCELLLEIEARAGIPNGQVWALEERAPYPVSEQPKD